jgi:serine protease Do
MNTKLIFAALGCSALAMGLVALPGSSAWKPEPARTTERNAFQTEHPQAAADQIVPLRQEPQQMQLYSADEDDDVRVFVGSGGSWVGAGINEVTSDKVKELKLPAERGVVLGKIVPDSPAANAGLKEGDVVTEINRQRVEGTEQFRRMIREIPAGRAVQFTVWRDGRSQSVEVTLGKAEVRHGNTFVAPAAPGSFAFQVPEMPPTGNLIEGGPWVTSRTRLGIDAENLDGEFGNYFGAPDGEGILIRGVFPDTPAAKAGLKAGDVIVSVNGERIRSVGELRAKIADKEQEKSVKLGLIRNRSAMTLSVELPPPAEKKTIRRGERTNI